MPNPVTDQELSAAIAEIPPVSVVLQRMLAVLQDPRSDLDDITRLVRAETALAAQVLRLVNSAHYGLPEPVTSIPEAVQHLGVTEISRLVSALAGRQLFLKPLQCYGIASETLWNHSLAVAVCAETLATVSQQDRSTAYLAGILHSVGMVALDRVGAVRKAAPRGDQEFANWEEATFGTSNPAVAALVLKQWKFPHTLAHVVGGRYQPSLADKDGAEACLLFLASCLAERIGAGLDPERGLFLTNRDYFAAASVPWEEFAELEMEAAQNFERTKALLRIG